MKKCSKCKVEKPLDQFSKDESRRDNLSPTCKPCIKNYHKEYYLRNRENVTEKVRKRYEENPNLALERSKRRYETNKQERLEQIRQWRGNNKHKIRWYGLKAKYGITKEEYESLIEKQNNVCAICKMENTNGKPLCVDHEHSTGKIRGLLCFSCNTALGLMKEHSCLLREAATYLEKD